MRDFSSWSLNLGRWGGVHVRLHALFLLFAVFTLYLSAEGAKGAANPADHGLVGYAAASLAILLASVVLHEIGHCVAAYRVGGRVDEIVLGPLGGLAQASVPNEPHYELITALAGPAVNLVLWLSFVPPLVVLIGGDEVRGLLNPLQPSGLIEGTKWIVALKLACWLNWLLVLVNLLPAFPMDGGRVLRALLWPAFGYRTAVLIVTWGAKLTAAGMCVLAWLMRNQFPESIIPAWVPLILIAIFLYFSAKQEAERLAENGADDEIFGYDFSQGYTSLDRATESARPAGPGPLRRWLEQRRAGRMRRRRMIEEDEERRVDEILARLHDKGPEGISEDERALLNRVSARYRNRQGH